MSTGKRKAWDLARNSIAPRRLPTAFLNGGFPVEAKGIAFPLSLRLDF
jgi:hypothetical protein